MTEIKFPLGGKERGFNLGLGFLGDVQKHYDTSLEGLGRLMIQNPLSVTPAILFYAHMHYCARNAIPVDFNIYNMQDWVEELSDPMNDKNIEALLKLLVDSIQKYLPKVNEKEGQKKN